jgi:two-component system LytT family response regulator
MSKLKAILVDDEVHCLETLEWQLENYCPDVEMIEMFRSPTECIAFLENNEIDILFLDIEMPMINGFELLKSLKAYDFELIFTTAYDEQVRQASEECGVSFLLKPIDKTELLDAVSKAHGEKTELRSRLKKLFHLVGNEL